MTQPGGRGGGSGVLWKIVGIAALAGAAWYLGDADRRENLIKKIAASEIAARATAPLCPTAQAYDINNDGYQDLAGIRTNEGDTFLSLSYPKEETTGWFWNRQKKIVVYFRNCKLEAPDKDGKRPCKDVYNGSVLLMYGGAQQTAPK